MIAANQDSFERNGTMSYSLRFPRSLRIFLVISIVSAVSTNTVSNAQVSGGNPNPPPPQPEPLPFTTQIKKTIVFLESDCVHDFHRDVTNLTSDRLAALSSDRQSAILNQLNVLIMRFGQIKASRAKLSAEEIARLFPEGAGQIASANNVPEEIQWKLQVLIRMAALTEMTLPD